MFEILMQSMHFEIRNALTRVGDPVQFELRTTTRAGLELCIEPHALGADGARPVRRRFEWTKENDAWTGQTSYVPAATGHFLATLFCDGRPIAGRYFAAITGNEAVACTWINGLLAGKDDYGDVMRPHYLPFDYHVDIDIGDPDRKFLRRLRAWDARLCSARGRGPRVCAMRCHELPG